MDPERGARSWVRCSLARELQRVTPAPHSELSASRGRRHRATFIKRRGNIAHAMRRGQRQVAVAGLSRIHGQILQYRAQRSDARGRPPVGAAIHGFAGTARTGIEKTEPQRSFRRLAGFRGCDIEHTGQPIAVAGRKSAGKNVDAFDQVFVEQTERALIAGQVIHLPQRKSVEQYQHLVGLSAAQIARRRHAALNDPGQAAQRANRVIGDVRVVGERHCVEPLRTIRGIVRERVAAGLDDDRIERDAMQPDGAIYRRGAGSLDAQWHFAARVVLDGRAQTVVLTGRQLIE